MNFTKPSAFLAPGRWRIRVSPPIVVVSISSREVRGIGGIFGADLLRGMFGVIYQYGRKTTYCIESANTGVLPLVLLADDDLHLERLLARVIRAAVGSGHVHEDVALSRIAGQPAKAFQVRGD